MNKFFTLLAPLVLTLSAKAQTPYNGPTTMPYGKVDKADLELTACDFEKDANAEVLFDKGTVSFTPDYNLVFERHVRIKIFNEKGQNKANVRIEYQPGDGMQVMSDLQAETINSNNGVPEITKLDKKQFYTKHINKYYNLLSFAFPNVKAGSIIEYKFDLISKNLISWPKWYFQDDIPTRYSELSKSVPSVLYYKSLIMVDMPYVKNTEDLKALANVPSLHDEPFMSSWGDNAQRAVYQLKSVNAPGLIAGFSDSWQKVGKDEVGYDDFGDQVRRKLTGQDEILAKAKTLHSDNEKIAYIFNEVKNHMKWNDENEAFTEDGTSEAWDKKIGNSTEINLGLCHLLQKSGVKALPMLVSTRKNGKVNPAYSSPFQFNKAVVYIPVDTSNYYVLDASNKYNVYNDIPRDLLNGFGFYMDKENEKYDLFFIDKAKPVMNSVLVNGEIKADGKITGTAQINSYSYNRLDAVEKYKTDGEEKYRDYLRDDDNNLKISNLKFDNMEVDTLPLTQNIDFSLTLAGSDDTYLYVNPNLFTGLHSNTFLNENRFTDIDFGYRDNFSINGVYKMPAGYKVDALPKSISMAMPDKSIVFRRLVAEEDGTIAIRFSVDYKKSVYFKEDYPEFHAFFKKMYELLNEQIVLKKS